MTNLTIKLKNPPSGAELWFLVLCDWAMTIPIHFVGWESKQNLGIAEAATFEVPAGISYPLRVVALQITKWNETKTALIQLYYVQSMHPNQYDWDTGTFTGPLDPTYRDLFIPQLGSYYYNVATEKFELIETYSGSIIKKELEYNESKGIIPVAGVLQNKSGLFHVTARNDMTTSQYIGIYWFIADPDGMIAEEYTDWKFGTLGPGQTHEFIGDRFTFTKVGKYTTWIDLLMGSQENPVVIYSARYIGELCTVVAAPTPVFSELKISSFSKV